MPVLVPIYARSSKVAETIVDDDVVPTIIQDSRLRMTSDGYARVRGIRIHRLIVGVGVGDPCVVDHLDRDRLNNQRCNLRVVTQAMNSQNLSSRDGSSRHRGVSFNTKAGKWQARMRVNYGAIDLHGLFDTEDEAMAQVCVWRREHMPMSVEGLV